MAKIIEGDPRPAPYPSGTKAGGWRFELDLERVTRSDTWKRAVRVPGARAFVQCLWSSAWLEVPCGSLPNDDESIALAADVPDGLWPAVRDIVMRGWWLADDGRLYHDTIVERVHEMMDKRRSGADRAARARAKKAASAGAVTRYSRESDAPHEDGRTGESDPKVTRDKGKVTRDSRDSAGELQGEYDTYHLPPTTVDGELRTSASRARAQAGAGADAGERARDRAVPDWVGEAPPDAEPPDDLPGLDDDDMPPEPVAISEAARLGFLLRAAGMQPHQIRTSDPRVAKALDEGIPPELIAEFARTAVAGQKDNPMSWAIAAARGAIRDAAAPAKPASSRRASGPTSHHGINTKDYRAGITPPTDPALRALYDEAFSDIHEETGP